MSYTQKRTQSKSKSHSGALLRGISAVAGAGAILALAVFLLSRQPPPTASLPESSAPPVSDSQPSSSYIPENPYGPEDFAYDGEYLTCLTGSARLGVDVSAHQGKIDWDQVAQSGMEFAMVRIGYRGTTSGGLYADEYADQNLRGAREAGLKVGAYFYSQATSTTEAALEAAYCISLLDQYTIDMPVVFDWEYSGSDSRSADVDGETLMTCAQVFCQAISDAGYTPMVYFNPTLAESHLDLEQLRSYPFWLAMYSDKMTFPYAVEMWQYTATGNVPGISGDADVNLWFTD